MNCSIQILMQHPRRQERDTIRLCKIRRFFGEFLSLIFILVVGSSLKSILIPSLDKFHCVFFYVLTMQKSNQFGIMKAIGAKNGFLGKAVISQVFVLSLVSIVIGILLTCGTAAVLPKGMPFKLETGWVIAYSLVLLAIALLSSLVSVRTIVKVDPLKALGRVES